MDPLQKRITSSSPTCGTADQSRAYVTLADGGFPERVGQREDTHFAENFAHEASDERSSHKSSAENQARKSKLLELRVGQVGKQQDARRALVAGTMLEVVCSSAVRGLVVASVSR
jgi:hypothetical protein